MRREIVMPRCLRDLTDADLLDRAFEPEFMHCCSTLETELLWRLAACVQAIELERAARQAMLEALCLGPSHRP
jgi:hypothetical protein